MSIDLTRRDFFSNLGRLVVLVPAGWMIVGAAGCGSSSSGECTGADTVMDTGAALIVVSSCTGINGGHTHDYTVQDADLAAPPAAGVSGLTSPYDDDQHTHTIALTMADLASIQAGQTVTIESGKTGGHSHTFHFHKA
jgi:hypothetical protein